MIKGRRAFRGRIPAAVPVFTAALLLTAAPAGAHQPRLVRDRPSIIVSDPETSQAFYAWLKGGPQTYYIRSDKRFILYLNLLVPDQPGIDTDYEAAVFAIPAASADPIRTAWGTPQGTAAGEIITRLDGSTFGWTKFHEPFGGDRYLMGPEFERRVEAGRYRVVVSSPDNEGRYALAIGKAERFPPGEIIRTIGVLPTLKKEFFGKSPLTAYFNLSGAFLLVIVGGAIGLGALFF